MLIDPLGEQLTSFADIMFRRVTTRNTTNNTSILEVGETVFGPGEKISVLKGVVIRESDRNFGVKIFSKLFIKIFCFNFIKMRLLSDRVYMC